MTTETKKRPRLKTGDLLHNGAEILLAQYVRQDVTAGGYDEWLVLCKWNRTHKREFVTWKLNLFPDGHISAVWGHYFAEANAEAAIRDYARRIK